MPNIGFWAAAGAGAAALQSWISNLTGVTFFANTTTSVTLDLLKNIYISGQIQGSTDGDGYVSKLDSNGAIQWSRRVTASVNGVNNRVLSTTTSPSGNVYGQAFLNSSGSLTSGVFKLDSSGTLQWQKGNIGADTSYPFRIALDSSENLYVGQSAGGASHSQIWKWTSAGAVSWAYQWVNGNYNYLLRLALDSSNNIYGVGVTAPSTQGKFTIQKISSTPSFVWGRYNTLTGNDQAYGVATDSSGNVIAAGYIGNLGIGIVVKYDPSGTLLWQRSFNGVGSWNDIAVDSTDNIYVTGNNGYIVKYNSSGTIQWQRTFTVGGATSTNWAIKIGPEGSLNIAIWRSTATTGQYLLRLPTDGTLTGSYTSGGYSWTYAAGSGTDAAGTMTFSTTTSSANNIGLTPANTNSTFSSLSITSTVTNIP